MCNRLHSDSQPIPKEGKAWKVVNQSRELQTMLYTKPYEVSDDGWVRFDHRKHYGDGFCLSPTRKEARRLQKLWKRETLIDVRVVRVEYRGGIGKHLEDNICTGMEFPTLLVEEWRPI